jgi:hypothetical protein
VFFPVEAWFAAFLLTVAVEMPVAVYLVRSAEPDLARRTLVCLVANLASHPIVWFVLTQIVLVATAAYVAVAEGWAIAAEAVVYAVALRDLSARRAIVVSLAANATSFVAGRVVTIVWPDMLQ